MSLSARARAVAVAAALAAGACAHAPTPAQSGAYADFLVGRIANHRDDYAAAADRYFAGLARAPGDEALQRGALAASLAAGDHERARRAARFAPGEDAPAQAHLIRAVDALRAGRYARAAEEADRAEGGAAESLVARMLFLWARVGAGREDEVLSQLEPLAAIRPYGGLFAYQQAMALDIAGREAEALSAYEAAARSGSFSAAGIERHADALIRAGRAEEGVLLLRRANAQNSNPALAAALARVEAGQSAPRLTTTNGAALGLFGLGVIFIQERDPYSGLIALSLAMMLDPGLDVARLAFAEAHGDAGQITLARAALAQVSASSPYAATARISEAWLLLGAGQEEEALALASAGAAGGDARARRALADINARLGRYAEAEPLYASLRDENPDDWRLHFLIGAARERQGRWEEAEADLRRALALSPDQPDVLNYLGYTWVDRGEHLQEGLAMIRRAVALRPTSGAIIDSLGWAYYRLGDYEQALIHLERAVELEPADPTLNDHLGDVYWRLGRRIEARFQWRRALTLRPDDAAAIEAKLESGLPPSRTADSR